MELHGDHPFVSSSFHRAVSSGSGHVGAHVRGHPTVQGTLLIHAPAGGHGPLLPLAAVHVLVRESAALRFFGRMPRAKPVWLPVDLDCSHGAAPFYTPAALSPKGSNFPTSCHTGCEAALPGFDLHLLGDRRGRAPSCGLAGHLCLFCRAMSAHVLAPF